MSEHDLEDDEIEYLTEEEIAAALSVSNFSTKYYVYFEENGDISSISNERKTDRSNFLEFEHSEVEQFLTGKENYLQYKLSLMDKDTPALIKKSEYEYYTKSVFTPIDYPSDSETKLRVVWNGTDSTWEFSLSDDYKERLRRLGLTTKLMFFVSLDKNVNFVIRTILVDMHQLVYNSKVVVPFAIKEENEKKLIALSTKKFFDSYGLTVYE